MSAMTAADIIALVDALHPLERERCASSRDGSRAIESAIEVLA